MKPRALNNFLQNTFQPVPLGEDIITQGLLSVYKLRIFKIFMTEIKAFELYNIDAFFKLNGF